MSDSRTDNHLNQAFVGEAKASLRLLAYAEKAMADGYLQMAKLFRAISEAEKVHALKHLRLMKLVGTTEENLQASFEREISVSENVYPEMIRVAEEEGRVPARISFSQTRDAEDFHAKLYKNALAHMLDERETTYHVCLVCGYVADGHAPEACPVCNAPKEKFKQVD